MNNLYESEVDSIVADYNSVYDEMFGKYFNDVNQLYRRMQSDKHPISDDELSWVLISLPLMLFDVSEQLNSLKLKCSVIQLKHKQDKIKRIRESSAKTVAAKQDDAFEQLIDNDIVIAIYQAVVDRVESEISLARELIMGAKKIWDGRRKTEESNPVGINNLPDYKVPIYGGSEV